MILSIIVLIFCFIMAVMMSACVMKLDEIEKHDEAVRMRWADAGESEPPEWADPEKWRESEGNTTLSKIKEGSISTDRIADEAFYEVKLK